MGAIGLVLSVLAGWPLPALAQDTERVSVSSGGGDTNGTSSAARISGNGRYVTFVSDATNIVVPDLNGKKDCFVRDNDTGATILVNVSDVGVQGDKDCESPDISDDGRYVVFSTASDLVAGDTNGDKDVFRVDRDADGNGTLDEPGLSQIERVSVDQWGAQRNSNSINPRISGDGAQVVFQAKNGSNWSIWAYSSPLGVATLQSADANGVPAGGTSENPTISETGRYVVFESNAPDIILAADNSERDVFLVDRDPDGNGVFDEPSSRTVEWISEGHEGATPNGNSRYPAISSEGGHVAFASAASNLVELDGNSKTDVFVRNRSSGATTLLSRTASGGGGNADSSTPEISTHGRFVAFQSQASDLIAGVSNNRRNVFRADRDADQNGVLDDGMTVEMTLESVSSAGVHGDEHSGDEPRPDVAADGTWIAFSSAATNLVPTDGNGKRDVFRALSEFCGNGEQGPGEECEDGNLINGDGCDNNCTASRCGNGVQAAGEACDDGNLDDGDGCDSNCTPTGCGNGVVSSGETCDDGDLEDGDGCDSNCTETGCGNEIVTSGETCDDGDQNGLTCCNELCALKDYDLDETCDDLDFADLTGGSIKKVKVKETKADSSKFTGVVNFKLDIDFSAQSLYASAAEFLEEAESTGFGFSIHAGPGEPEMGSGVIYSAQIEPQKCIFAGTPGNRTRANCHHVELPPESGTIKLKIKSGKSFTVVGTASRLDIATPQADSVYVVFNSQAEHQLDFASVSLQCSVKGSRVQTLKCK